jgi:hypothetical protein
MLTLFRHDHFHTKTLTHEAANGNGHLPTFETTRLPSTQTAKEYLAPQRLPNGKMGKSLQSGSLLM